MIELRVTCPGCGYRNAVSQVRTFESGANHYWLEWNCGCGLSGRRPVEVIELPGPT